MSLLISFIFRLSVAAFLVYLYWFTHVNILGRKEFSIQSLLDTLKSLSIVNIIIEIIYCIVATPVQQFRRPKIHGSIYCISMAFSLLVCTLFWGIYIYDAELLGKQFDDIPFWFNHSMHTFPLITLLLDAIFWKPHVPPWLGTALMTVFLVLVYTIYLEYLIQTHNIYVYPILDRFSTSGRYAFYGAVLLSMLLSFVLSYKLIRLTSRGHKKSHTKPKSKADKPQSVQPQAHQKKKNRKTD